MTRPLIIRKTMDIFLAPNGDEIRENILKASNLYEVHLVADGPLSDNPVSCVQTDKQLRTWTKKAKERHALLLVVEIFSIP
jgi:hypothetical protein